MWCPEELYLVTVVTTSISYSYTIVLAEASALNSTEQNMIQQSTTQGTAFRSTRYSYYPSSFYCRLSGDSQT